MDIVRKIIREEIERILLNEARFDEITGKIVDKIWALIKHSKKQRSNKSAYYLEYKSPLSFKIYVFINRFKATSFKKSAYAVGGDTILGTSSVKIDIDIIAPNRDLEHHLYSELNTELNHVIRHEIEHIVQQPGDNYIDGRITAIGEKEREEARDTYRYFINDEEVPAMVAGFYRAAKTDKVPIDQIAREYLNGFIKVEPWLNDEQIEEIMDIWMKYAHENYPAAKFSSKYETF